MVGSDTKYSILRTKYRSSGCISQHQYPHLFSLLLLNVILEYIYSTKGGVGTAPMKKEFFYKALASLSRQAALRLASSGVAVEVISWLPVV